MITILFTELAKDELKSARDWYNRKENGLGKEFVLHIEKEIEWISTYPLSSQQVDNSDVRCKTVLRFPYYIYFEFLQAENMLIILAIAHQRKLPLI